MKRMVRVGFSNAVLLLALGAVLTACGNNEQRAFQRRQKIAEAAYAHALANATPRERALLARYFVLTCEDTISPMRAASFDTLLVSAPMQTDRTLHDCQKLMIDRDEYGPLVGLEVGDSMDDRVQRALMGVVLADVPDFDDTREYPKLNIKRKPLMNCLWVKGEPNNPAGWDAAIRQGVNCTDTTKLTAVVETLSVHPLPYHAAGPHPSTVRWGWDRVKRTQFIGIRCGPNLWCEIGPRNFHGSGATFADGIGLADEQYLAVEASTAPGTVRPSYVWGRIEPYDTLAKVDSTQLKPQPVLVARIILHDDSDNPQNPAASNANVRAQYARRYKLASDATNLYMWYDAGTYKVGTTPTWNAATWSDLDRCPWTHAGAGAVRWRWSATDEAIWMACSNGCCNATEIGLQQ